MFRLGKKKSLTSVPPAGWMRVFEPFTGAWQRNVEWQRETVLAHHAIFSCITLIASDISKLNINMMQKDSNGIWVKKDAAGKAAVLDRPNSYQNRIQFIEQWVMSKLSRGNAYILKGRTGGIDSAVDRLYVLNPDFVLPLVTDNGDVYYQLSQDNLAQIGTGITVPSSEIIHDRFNCFYHPLVGLSPIYASGLAAYNGLQIQENSSKFFQNGSRPSGVITAPGQISPETAERLKAEWQAGYTGANIGKTAILGDGLKYEAMFTNPGDAQMVEQLRLTAEIVCSTFHVPKYKVIGDAPSYNNIEALEQQYYSQCLQKLIEDIELSLDKGLDVSANNGVEFDLDGLLRMDSKTQVESLTKSIGGGLTTPNEARKSRNLPPIKGGDTVYMQEQNHSLAALAARDAREDPFASKSSTPALPAPKPDAEEEDEDGEQSKAFFSAFSKALGIMPAEA